MKNTLLPYITPEHVGGMPECFMSTWTCPVCGIQNDESFLIDGVQYRCEGCGSLLEYKVPPVPHKKRKIRCYSFLLSWNW